MATEMPELSISAGIDPQNVKITFGFDSPEASQVIEAVENALNSFLTAGSHGGFAARMTDPSRSFLTLLRKDSSPSEGQWFELHSRELDFRAFNILRNMCWKISSRTSQIRSISVHGDGSGPAAAIDVPQAAWGTEDKAYPSAVNPLAFSIDQADPVDYQKVRRVLVEFGRRVETSVFDALGARLREWVALAEAGGFAPPVKSPDSAAIWEDALAPYDAYSVELSMAMFESSEFAWNPLVNLVQQFAMTVEPVALVTIE